MISVFFFSIKARLIIDDHSSLVIFNKSIKLNPINHYAYVAKGNCFLKTKEYKKALKCYNKAIELDSNDSNAITNKELCFIAFYYRKKNKKLLQSLLRNYLN